MSNETSPAPITDAVEDSQEAEGGTFRLEALAPGSDGGLIDPSLAPARKGWRSTQTIALVVLVAAAVGIVYSMRQAGIGPISAFGTMKMPDYDVTKAPGSKTADHKRLLAELEATQMAGQVPADKVQRNPFELAELLGEPVQLGDPDAALRAMSERQRREAEAARRRVESEIAGMQINALLGATEAGTTGVVRLSGEIYRVGDRVGEFFTVRAIRPRSVDLEHNGMVYTVSMDEDDKKKKK